MVRQSLLLYVSLLISPNRVSWWLLSNMKHDTSSIILYMCLAISARSIWPLLSPDTQIPFLRPGAVFVATITLLPFLRGMGWRWWAITARADFLPQILTGYSTIDRIRFVGPIANSCKLTIWRQQLWAMKGLKIRERERALKGGEEENMKFTLQGGRNGGDLRAELPGRRGWNFFILSHRSVHLPTANRDLL